MARARLSNLFTRTVRRIAGQMVEEIDKGIAAQTPVVPAPEDTEILPRDVTGRIWINGYERHLRTTSTIQAVVMSMDLEPEGFDAFIAVEASDAAFGALVREALGRTRFLAFEDHPYNRKGSGFGKKLAAWENRALKREGKSRLTELHRTASCCACTRAAHVIRFENMRKAFDVGDGFYPILRHDPQYRHRDLPPDAGDAELGQAAREMLEAMVLK